jgi:hypothetical protein
MPSKEQCIQNHVPAIGSELVSVCNWATWPCVHWCTACRPMSELLGALGENDEPDPDTPSDGRLSDSGGGLMFDQVGGGHGSVLPCQNVGVGAGSPGCLWGGHAAGSVGSYC